MWQFFPVRGGVPLQQREGVFVHSFICADCGVRFNIYSWQARRHTRFTITCPECGQQAGRFLHFRCRISEMEQAFSPTHPGEIDRHCPHPGSLLVNDGF